MEGYLTLLFCTPIDFALDDLAKINRTYKDLKSLSLTSNAKLAQSRMHQCITHEISGLILSGGIFS